MQTINIPVNSTPPNFSEARRKAVGKAREVLSEPVIVAWKDERSKRSGPEIPGGNEDRWHDYGESNAGKLELSVGDEYHFIFTEAADFDEPDLNLASVPDDDGNNILCLNDACTMRTASAWVISPAVASAAESRSGTARDGCGLPLRAVHLSATAMDRR